MNFSFGKSSNEENRQEGTKEGRNQNALLVLLLLLVGGFSYVYFFTDLIREQQAPPAPVPAPQVVKSPLPAREGEGANVAAQPEAKKESVKAEAAKPAEPKKEPAKVAQAVPAAKETPKPAAKEAPKPVAKEAPKPAAKEAPKPAAKEAPKPVAPVAADKKEAKGSAVAKAEDKKSVKPAAAPEKKVAGKGDKKPVPQPVAKPAAKPVESYGSGWTVVVGNYLLEDALSSDMGKVRKAGLEPVVKSGSRRKTTMNRLLLAEYTDRATAMAELEKLKKKTADAFLIDQGEKHIVYAGSYLLDARANSEKERLSAAGYSLMLKRTEIAIPSRNLIVGPYADKAQAEAVLKKLQAAGLKVSLAHQ